MWETFLQAAPPPTGLYPSKTHSAAQPHAPEHALHGQPSPVTPADNIGPGANYNQLEEQAEANTHQLEE